MKSKFNHLPYSPKNLPRELKKFYISASQQDIDDMLGELGLTDLTDLYQHIPKEVKFDTDPDLGSMKEHLPYEEILEHMEMLSKNNNVRTSFVGDGLQNYKVHELVPFVSDIRGLTTAYTPYQPERSQGTLGSLWLYSNALSMLTGFEAVNASMYDRSTCLFEALNTAIKLTRKSDTVIVLESIYPGDMEVLETLNRQYKMNIVTVPVNPITGVTDIDKVRQLATSLKGRLGGIAFPQVNSLGNLEDVHDLTDIADELGVQSIAIIDPMLLANDGLIPPSQFGTKGEGTTMIVGEGQHLAIGPNYGGPGLGIFGIRYNAQNKNAIRQTPGRYVGKGQDISGRECLAMVLSTREQHIRREKATSNICSNQAFIATLAGAGILGRGETGMSDSMIAGRNCALEMAIKLTACNGVNLAFPDTPFFNEFTLELPVKSADLIAKARASDLFLGVDVSGRTNCKANNHLMISFSDIHSEADLKKLEEFFINEFGLNKDAKKTHCHKIPPSYMRVDKAGLPNFGLDELKTFYTELGLQNVSPDDNLYPLGSCTMKYNPYINDYAASLPGFTDIHPQVDNEDAQGSLEVLYHIQEFFKNITGLPGVTTQPLAGAQGEFTGIKLFQAYHRERGEADIRNIILIPHTAHGTNPATATMAGFETKVVDGIKYGIVEIEADEIGQIDFEQLKSVVNEYGDRISGIMVTNPNTSGIFETRFLEMANLIHENGGLVYMDGANMNAIAGWVDLGKMGVDAVHNNLHKTWSISHGGGGPGDAIVAVSDKLVDYLPGIQVKKEGGRFITTQASKTIGSVHRHHGNFAHKIRCYSYIKALGSEGIKQMSAVSVLSAKYLYKKLKDIYPTLPVGAENEPRMHEFILTITKDTFEKIAAVGIPKAQAIAKIGKLFLDFGMHAPTVAFPEVFGLMVEPTESFTKKELDRFIDIVITMNNIIQETPQVLATVPHFTPIDRVDEAQANKILVLSQKIDKLWDIPKNRIAPAKLSEMAVAEIYKEIQKAHKGIKA